MPLALPLPPLLAITDRKATPLPLALLARSLFTAGLRWLSLREPDLDPVRRITLLRSLCLTGAEFGATIGVHHDLAAAVATKAGALHLSAKQVARGDARMARGALAGRCLIGASCHTAEDLARAAEEGADYAVLSPVYSSLSKRQDFAPLGVDGFAALVAKARLPVLALSGVTTDKVAACRDAGAAGVAVMGGLMRAADPAATVKAYLAAAGGIAALQVL